MTLGSVASIFVVILPVLGNIEMLRASHLWIVLVIGILASVFQPSYNPFTFSWGKRDGGTGAQIIWSVYLTQLAAVLEAAYLRYPVSVEWDVVAGIALVGAALGLALRMWAVLTLGGLFTMHISVEKDHKIIRSGPYSMMRHPSYVGAFFLYVGTAVFLHSLYSAILSVVILPLAFLRRIYREERVLREEFGPEYESYCLDVKMILPGIW